MTGRREHSFHPRIFGAAVTVIVLWGPFAWAQPSGTVPCFPTRPSRTGPPCWTGRLESSPVPKPMEMNQRPAPGALVLRQALIVNACTMPDSDPT